MYDREIAVRFAVRGKKVSLKSLDRIWGKTSLINIG